MISIRRVVVCVAVAASLAVPHRVAAQTAADTSAILETVRRLFDAMAARDSAALAALVEPAGAFAIVVVDHDTVITVQHSALSTFIARIGTPGPALLERIWEPRVMIEGPFAAVWTEYDFHIDGRFNHCGIDVFTLARVSDAWRITGGSYTIRQQGCTPSPLGAP